MMRFAEELVDATPLDLPSKSVVRDKEVQLAITLMESLAGKWEPQKYHDQYRANLMRLIEAKIKGKKPKLEETAATPGGAEVVDLMERLRKSLQLSAPRGRTSRATTKRAAKKTSTGARKTKRARHAA
jgi:DNA end-binding protein Ku